MNLKRMLETAAERYGGKTVIVSGERRISYSELAEESSRLAAGLLRAGLTKGDHVAVMAANSPEYIAVCFGIVNAGAVVVPLDPKYKPAELDALFGDSRPRFLVADSETLELLNPHLSHYPSIEVVIDIDSKSQSPFLNYSDLVASPAGENAYYPDPEDTAFVFYTSGATFKPLGVMLSHGAMTQEAKLLGDGFGQTDKDVLMLFALPLYHVFGMVAVVLSVISHGSSLVIVPGTGLSIGTFFAAIEEEKGTMFLGVPYIFSLAIDMAEKQGIKSDLSSLRVCCSSGDFLPVDVIERFKELFGYTLIDGFALTEAVCHVTCVPLDGSLKPGSVGRALTGWQVRTVDENGTDVGPKRSGEIIVKGPITKGYLNNPAAEAEFIRDGWFYTGDMGRLDESGVLYYTGRKKNIIILKGQNIVPDDIEHVLRLHPGIDQAVVFGIPDKMRGEIVAAAVKLKPGQGPSETEIRKFCLEYMTDYKAPKKVMFVDDIPLKADGRTDLAALKCNLSVPPRFPETV